MGADTDNKSNELETGEKLSVVDEITPVPGNSKAPDSTSIDGKEQLELTRVESRERRPSSRRFPRRRYVTPPRRSRRSDEIVVEGESSVSQTSDSDDGDHDEEEEDADDSGRFSFFKNWRRLIPAISYHHILMGLLVVTIVLQGLVLSGCTSPTFRSNYIISAAYSTTNGNGAEAQGTARSEVLAYLRNATESAKLETSDDWTCDMFGRATRKLQSEGSADPLGLLEYMVGFSTQVIFYGLFLASMILCGVSIVGFATFPGWHEETDETGSLHEVKPFPSKAISILIMWSLGLATMFGFVSVIWMHMTAVAAAGSLDFIFGDILTTHIGWMPLFFGWLSVFLEALVFVGIIIMIISIKLLDLLTEDED